MWRSLSGFHVPVARRVVSLWRYEIGLQQSEIHTLKFMLYKRHRIVVILGAHLLDARREARNR